MTEFPRPPLPPRTTEGLAAQLEDVARRLATLENLFRHHRHADPPVDSEKMRRLRRLRRRAAGDPRDELRHQVALEMTGQTEDDLQ